MIFGAWQLIDYSLVCLFQDVPFEEVEVTDECDPPHLLFGIDSTSEEGQDDCKYIYVVGDGIHIKCHDNCTPAILQLLAVYYVFQLEYPRIYSQLLGLLQTLVTSEPYRGQMSSKYKRYAPTLKTALNAAFDEVSE